MASGKRFRRTVAAAAILMALSLQAASANDVAYFKDVAKPGGHARSMTAKLADGRACGVSGDTITVLMPAFQKCMSGRGWALDHYGPDPSQPRPRATTVNFTDMKGDAKQQPRGATALQSATRACNASAKDPESAVFKTCMAGRGWQFTFTQRAPAPAAARATATSWPNGWAWSNSGPASSPSSTIDDLAQINADIAQGSQDSADAMNAGIQATTQADAASDAQWQLNSELANAPTTGN
ncbi:MAG: hypothetical protein WBB34_10170 [Xanthobacteraceae bacterium]